MELRTDIPKDVCELLGSFDKDLRLTLDFDKEEHRRLYATWRLKTGELFPIDKIVKMEE